MQQGILGTQKGNELLWTAPSKEDPQVRDVYFGFAHFASYHQDDIKARNILVGVMGATSIRRQAIADAFGVNRCLVARYTREMRTGGAEIVVRDQRGRKPKVTHEIEGFVRREFRKLYAKSKKGYVVKLIKKVEKRFDVTLSGELIRQITKPLRDEMKKAKGEGKKAATVAAPSVPSVRAVDEDLGENGEALIPRLDEGFHSRYAGGLLLNAFIAMVTQGVFEEE